jgi:RimJ/RimL family protein N-acetyltransferase
MLLETPRLLIRSFTEKDIAAYAEIVANSEVTRYLGDGTPHSFEEAERYISNTIERDRDSGVARYAVVRKQQRDLIGFCGYWQLEDYVDFGWRYAQSAWGQGYGTEAALAVLDYGVTALGLTNIAAGAFVANTGSLRIIEKLGFPRSVRDTILGKPVIRYYQQHQYNNGPTDHEERN